MSTLATAQHVATAALIAVGSFFLFVGTVGLLRLPNVYNRMHATSKATTLGASSILLGVVVHYGPQGAGLTSLVGILFLFLTAPTGAHVISRAAQKMGVPFVEDSSWPRPTDGAGDDGESPADD
jgi:multicomponent Na+:H+ antiporter subunit G